MGESLTERCRVVDEALRRVNTFYEGESCSHHTVCDAEIRIRRYELGEQMHVHSFSYLLFLISYIRIALRAMRAD